MILTNSDINFSNLVYCSHTFKLNVASFSCWQVLKTGAFVNVSQDKAYDDICVMETTKLKEACEAD